MKGSQFDFEFHRGDSRKLRLTVVDEATPPVVVDLTTATTIQWAFSRLDPESSPSDPRPLSSTALVTKGVGTGVVVEDAVNGVVRVDLGTGDTTGQLAPADYYYEVQVVLGGETTTVLFGKLTLARDLIAPGP